MRRLWLCAVVLSASPLFAQNAGTMRHDWPQWRGPLRDAKSTETGLLQKWPEGGPKLLWSAKDVNGKKCVGTGWSSVSVANGRIFTQGDHGKDGFIFALEEDTGKIIWSTRIANGGGDGPRCTPTIDGDRVYALSRYGDLVCLGVEKGNIIWSTNYKKDFGGKMMSGWDYSESPLIDGDKLICTPGADSAALAALDKKTGAVIWKSEIQKCSGAAYASPVIAEVAGIRQYITLLGPARGIVGVDAKTGKFLWDYKKMANGTANIPTPIVKGDLVFTSTGYGAGAALLQLVPDGNGGIKAQEKYFLKGNVLQNHHGGMILLGDHIYGGHGHNNGLPFCLDMTSGKFAWSPVRGAGTGTAPVVYADGRLYFRYENNIMALVEATSTGYNLISQFTLPGNLATGWPHPVIVNGKMIIRGRDQVLCYDVKQR
jgi:outer membrane protein assembly factor BamB